MIMSYSCVLPEAKNMSAVWLEIERRHPCVRCHSAYDYMVMDRESSNGVVAETMEVRKRVKELLQKAASLAGRECKRGRREVLGDIGSVLCKQPRP